LLIGKVGNPEPSAEIQCLEWLLQTSSEPAGQSMNRRDFKSKTSVGDLRNKRGAELDKASGAASELSDRG